MLARASDATRPGIHARILARLGDATRSGIHARILARLGDAGGPGVLARLRDASRPGMHAPRRLPRDVARPAGPHRALQALMSGLGALIVLAICGLTGFFVIAGERRSDSGGTAATRPGEDNRWIRSRSTDSRPLTLPEVFPDAGIQMAPGAAPYKIELVHVDSDCAIAAAGRLGAVLDASGCSQVVRATITAPYGGYRVTAGLFNLVDAGAASRAGDQVEFLVESGAGAFAAMPATAADHLGLPPTDPLAGLPAQAPAQVGWRARGHYLIYCVIERPDGGVIPDGDRYADQITDDLVVSYLGDLIVGHRALAGQPHAGAAGTVPPRIG